MSFSTPPNGLATASDAPAGPIVFEADPSNLPRLPDGARALALTNAEGTVICVCTFAPQIPIEELAERGFEFIDLYESRTRSYAGPRLLP